MVVQQYIRMIIHYIFVAGKRREKAKNMKNDLHGLELRNIELKAEINWLEKEIAYLKSLVKPANSS